MAKDLPTFIKEIESEHPDDLRRVTRDADPANHDVTVGADAPVEDVVLTGGALDPRELPIPIHSEGDQGRCPTRRAACWPTTGAPGVDDVSLTIGKGENLTLVGEPGCAPAGGRAAGGPRPGPRRRRSSGDVGGSSSRARSPTPSTRRRAAGSPRVAPSPRSAAATSRTIPALSQLVSSGAHP